MLTLVFALLLLQAPSAQAPSAPSPQSDTTKQSKAKPEDMCTIEGIVLKATTGDPLKKVILTLRKSEDYSHPKSVASDASGHFQFKNVEPGRYRLYAFRNGYASQEYGQRAARGSGTILMLAAGQHLKDISFRLVAAAVIAGHVYDEDGEPLAEVQVQALRFRYEKGQRKLDASGGAMTNDLGEYRMFALAPGQYYVRASYDPGRFGIEGGEGGYAPVYYAGSSDPARATVLDLHAGDELPGVDFTLLPTKTFSVRGRVYDAVNNQPGRHAMVGLEPRNAEVRDWGMHFGSVDTDGGFEIHGVKPGSYDLLAMSNDGDKQYTAPQAVEVTDTDIEGVSLVIGPGIDLKGRVRVEGNAALKPDTLSLWLQPREARMHMFGFGTQASIKPDGSFVISNVADDDYRFSVGDLPEDFYLKAVRAGSSDALVSNFSVSAKQPPGAIEVVLSPNGGRIDGLVLKEDKPFSGATVVLVPEGDRSKEERLYKSTSTDQDGRFSIRGITPGDYTLFAWETVEHGAYQDPEFLRPYKDRGKPIHVDESSRLTSQLEMIPASEPDTP